MGSTEKNLINAYSGKRAQQYDQVRSNKPRWKQEQAIMTSFLDAVPPTKVVDCPFGTGRWFEAYEAHGMFVIAVDLSQDMLNEAKQKVTAFKPGRYDFRRGSIFDLSTMLDKHCADTFVCIRFLNWINREEVSKVLSEARKIDFRYLILGISVYPQEEGAVRQISRKLALVKRNRRNRKLGTPIEYVHEEKGFEKELQSFGYRVCERKETFRLASRVNKIFLCQKVE